MKKVFTQSLALVALIAIALMANVVSAGNPASGNPGGFARTNANNTPFPVTVGTYFQIKGSGGSTTGGGLAVEAFIAWQNAAFAKDVGIQGILTGKPIAVGSGSSNLLFGDAVTSKDVTVNTTGWTYAQGGGLYAPRESASTAGTYKPLCARQNGEIIVCPGAAVITGGSGGGGGSIRLVNDLPYPVAPYTNWMRNISPSAWTTLLTTDFPVDPQSAVTASHPTNPSGTFTVTANVGLDSRVIITNDTAGTSVCSGHTGTGNQAYIFSAANMSLFTTTDTITIRLTPGSTC